MDTILVDTQDASSVNVSDQHTLDEVELKSHNFFSHLCIQSDNDHSQPQMHPNLTWCFHRIIIRTNQIEVKSKKKNQYWKDEIISVFKIQ